MTLTIRSFWDRGILIRVRDPDVIAGANDALRKAMRKRRARSGADLAIELAFVVPGRAEIAGAISLHSGGRIIVEDQPVDQLR
ncbi:hypothetical protein [Catenuloplanes atrovinosus]|uniref:Uncharacterized protein n=1 Tax=Catenuloplanes atrovinosus TaxID=137266 RepID=A0AAE4C6S1_9ACTN|nr:hypothetical protein [Catenuloplanes atrovinosus]MDR7273821.1 hypothetical protein [Catenuloplanes atrovinosus]